MSNLDDHSAFLDDYFGECDEHLTTIGRLLLDAEQRSGQIAPPALQELFRAAHSIKGLSGMVALREAELLAHHLESYLRVLRDAQAPAPAAGLRALMRATRTLEGVLAAKREHREPPNIDGVIAELSGVETTSSEAAPLTPGGLPAAQAMTWQVVFVPSPELTARGVGVNRVRTLLAETSEIVDAAPRVERDGAISFQFIVEGDLTDLQAHGDDYGLTITRTTKAAQGDVDASPMAAAPLNLNAAQFVRVDLARLDELMRLIGDLVTSRARLVESLSKIAVHVPAMEWRAVQDNALAIDRKLRELRDGVMRVRLVRVGEILRRMPFVVSDLARESGREVRLEIIGQETEIDKFVVERLMDPILHLVRNAVSHGVERAEDRIAQGKPAQATITLSASSVGDMVVLQIADDGRGIDTEAVIRRARAAGINVPAGVDAAALLPVLCTPGFSTRESADRASGRGVGMAVVQTTVHELGGRISMESTRGAGTRFTLEVPLTLSITDAILTRVGAQTFAVPQAAIREVIELQHGEVRRHEHHEIAHYRDRALPIVRLARVFGLTAAPGRVLHVFVVGDGAKAVGLAVDRILGQRDIVVRALNDPSIKVAAVAGATDLGDGRPVLILDPARIAATAHRSKPAPPTEGVG